MSKSRAAARGSQKATLGQLREVSRLVEIGSIDLVQMQGFIRSHRPFSSYPQPCPTVATGMLSQWKWLIEDKLQDELPPSSEVNRLANAVVEILLPFRWLQANFELMPAVADLELCCRQSIFWRAGGFRNLEVITPRMMKKWAATDQVPPKFVQAFRRSIDKEAVIAGGCAITGHHLMVTWQNDVYDQLFSGDGAYSIMHAVSHSLETEPRTIENWDRTQVYPAFEVFNATLDTNCGAVVAWAVDYRFNGHEALSRALWPLLQVMLEGNIPIGFTDEGDLLVFCGDAD